MEELLTCSVCCEQYMEVERQPVLLPRCGHSFCRPCVTLLLSNGCIICPTCRTDQRIEAAHRLPTEYTLLAIIAAQENSKLDNCKRHDVKLSFWCRTCELATCGECLFEDHPTHSHDVIRAITYINNMKDAVHEIACKFMDALDCREQDFYTTVFTCARRISDALRNVTVLRKDMSEARQLMTGIKEDNTSIVAASSLAEAAKYLGLKWNIQDANFSRKQEEEKGLETKKDAKNKDKIGSNKDNSVKEDKDGDKKEKVSKDEKKKKKKKSHSEKDIPKEVLKENETNTKEETEPIKVVAIVKESVSVETNTQTDVVKKKNVLRKSKTLSVLEPFNLEKEIMSIKNNLVDIDNKELEKLELEKKELLDEKEEELKRERKLIEEKEKELKEEQRRLKEKEDEQARKKAEEKEMKKKTDEAELNRLGRILMRPRGRLARKALAEKELQEALLKLEVEEAKALKRRLSLGVSNTYDKSDENPDNKDDNGKEKTNGEPEHKDKDKSSQKDKESDDEDGDNNEYDEDEEDDDTEDVDEEEEEEEGEEEEKEDDETPQAGSLTEDPYKGELTIEEKDAKGINDRTSEGEGATILEFMKTPLFVVCVEGAEGRLALVQLEPKGLHVYCHQFQELHYDIALKSNVLEVMIPSKSPIVFLDLSIGTGRKRRVYIRLWGHLRRAQNFLTLCLGDRGPTYLNTKLLQTYNVNEPGERVLGGDHEYNCGRGGKGILDDLEWNGDYSVPMMEGMLTAAGSGQVSTNSLFLMCTKSDISRNFSCPFGEIIEGLQEVRHAIRRIDEEVWIGNCGVVIEPPRSM